MNIPWMYQSPPEDWGLGMQEDIRSLLTPASKVHLKFGGKGRGGICKVYAVTTRRHWRRAKKENRAVLAKVRREQIRDDKAWLENQPSHDGKLKFLLPEQTIHEMLNLGKFGDILYLEPRARILSLVEEKVVKEGRKDTGVERAMATMGAFVAFNNRREAAEFVLAVGQLGEPMTDEKEAT